MSSAKFNKYSLNYGWHEVSFRVSSQAEIHTSQFEYSWKIDPYLNLILVSMKNGIFDNASAVSTFSALSHAFCICHGQISYFIPLENNLFVDSVVYYVVHVLQLRLHLSLLSLSL